MVYPVGSKTSAAAPVKGSWISDELKKLYGAKAWKEGKGVDLNGDGALQPNEQIATFINNTIPGNHKQMIGDWTDWLAFYRANAHTIHAKVGRNKRSIFYWASKFKTTNPLHIITSIESPLTGRANTYGAYRRTWEIIARARKIPIRGATELARAKAKFKAIHKTILQSGIKIKMIQDKHLFTDSIMNRVLDCDTASYIVLAEGHEKGWPVFGMNVPMHYFVRWHDPTSGVMLNMDSTYSKGRFPPTQKYRDYFKVSPHSVSTGIYLRKHTLADLVAAIMMNRGVTYLQLGKNHEAVRDSTEALKYNPKYMEAYNNRGDAYAKLNRQTDALTDYRRAIKLAPWFARSYYNRGTYYLELGRLADAMKDFKKAMALDPKFALSYLNLAVAYKRSGNNAVAAKLITKAIELKPRLSLAYYNRGVIYRKLKNYTASIRDFKKVLTLKPKDRGALERLESTYYLRGIARVKSKNYAGAVRDFKAVLKYNPKHSLAGYLIKKYTRCIRNPRKCRQ